MYGTLIATYIFILPYLNDGPYWRQIVYRESERCQTNWWTNVLFINNYVHTDELVKTLYIYKKTYQLKSNILYNYLKCNVQCIIPSWYLACDMHFFIVGTLLTYVIWRWRKPGVILLGVILTLSTIIPAYIIVRDQQRGTAPITPE